VAITVVLCYVLCLRVLARKSRELDKQIAHSGIRPWKGDEAKD